MESYIRKKFGSHPFSPGDIDLQELTKTLHSKRELDWPLVDALGLKPHQFDSLTEEQAVEAFNILLDSPSFFLKIDTAYLDMDPDSEKILRMVRDAHAEGSKVDLSLVRTLNRALLHAVYPNETKRTRKYERFSSPELQRSKVTLTFLPPAEGKPIAGKLLNISAGGMALQMEKTVDPGSFMALKLQFEDGSEIETIVQIRHSLPKDNTFICGFEFVSVPSYITDQLDAMARHYLECEERIAKGAADVCRRTCAFFNVCKKLEHL